MPYSSVCSDPVVLDGKVYIRSDSVLEYTPCTNTWVELPNPSLKCFGMTKLKRTLILVGGQLRGSDTVTNMISVWDSKSEQWTNPYPPMPTPRKDAGCAGYKYYLIVAGGIPDKMLSTSVVEILDTVTNQWYKAPPLPYNASCISSVTIGRYLYLLLCYRGMLTSSKTIIRASLPSIISLSIVGKTQDSSVWEKLPDVPLYFTSMFSIGNALLTAGGTRGGTASSALESFRLKSSRPSRDIYILNPFTNEWVTVDELPEARYACACIVLSSGELFVVGGEIGTRDGCLLSTAYKGTIVKSHF